MFAVFPVLEGGGVGVGLLGAEGEGTSGKGSAEGLQHADYITQLNAC